MPHQAQKWTNEQREAMGRAVVDDGLGAREVAKRCAAGTLLDGLEPFGPPPESTVRDNATKYRRRLEGRDRSPASKLAPHDALRSLFERVVSILEHGLETQERAAKVGRADPVKLGQFGKTLRDLIPVAKELDNAKALPTEKPASNGRRHAKDAPRTLADELIEGERRQQRAGVPSRGYADTHIGNADQRSPNPGDSSTPSIPTLTHADDSMDGGPDCAETDDCGEYEGMEAAGRLRSRLGLTHA